ncbi:MAG: prolipoprotein diacylglyceryl transferase [Bacillota bacterium]
MHPILFSIGPVTLYTYGLMLGLGFAAGVYVSSRRAESRGYSSDSLFWLFILLLIGGVVGGRLMHVALNTWYYQDWRAVLDTREGGLSIHGVLIGGALTVLAYSRIRKIPFGALTDIVAPGLALGQGIGRIGCFFSGCCYGIETSGAWGVMTRFAPGLRHPYQLYESSVDLALFAVLLWVSGRIAFTGGLFATYVTGYSATRFLLEFLRDNDSYLAGLSYGQWASLSGVLLGAAMYLGFRKASTVPPRAAV